MSPNVDDPDSDEEAANDIAEVLDGDFSADYVPRVPEVDEKEEKKGAHHDIEQETNEVRKFVEGFHEESYE